MKRKGRSGCPVSRSPPIVALPDSRKAPAKSLCRFGESARTRTKLRPAVSESCAPERLCSPPARSPCCYAFCAESSRYFDQTSCFTMVYAGLCARRQRRVAIHKRVGVFVPLRIYCQPLKDMKTVHMWKIKRQAAELFL